MVASYAYTLDPANCLTEEVHTWASGSSTDTTDYTYTDNNQLTGVTHSNSSFANESFSYDSNGNRTMTGYTTGTGNELTSDGTYDYTYDANGNMITKTDIATGDELNYTYDFRNRLVEVDQVVGGVESTLATYSYDAAEPADRGDRRREHDLDGLRRHEHGTLARLRLVRGPDGAVSRRAHPGGCGCGAGAGYALGRGGVVPDGSAGDGWGYRQQFGDGD